MRCKKHPLDLSGTAGVCASCLREKLLVLIAAQGKAQQAQLRSHGTATTSSSIGADLYLPPLNFPRSVSPYITRRKSDHTFVDQRFFSIPLVHPTVNLAHDVLNLACKKKSGQFGKIMKFCWPKFSKSEADLRSSKDPVMNLPASSSSPWISSALTARRKTKPRFTNDNRLRPCRPDDRGMSPERTSCDGDDDGRWSGYSSDATERWKQTPVTAPMSVSRRGKTNHGINVAGFAFCLSPLVRASPSRIRNHYHQKGGLPPDKGLPGEIRVPMKPHLSMAASFCANRSRKLGDFGRFNNNR